ncbi:MAG: hypothetical protein AAF218_05150 [Pseudomonadota bacterium]
MTDLIRFLTSARYAAAGPFGVAEAAHQAGLGAAQNGDVGAARDLMMNSLWR